MSTVLVDSNVILDVITEDAQWAAWSTAALEAVLERDLLIINPLIYAEVSVRFESIESLEDALPSEIFCREALPYSAAFLAGKCFVDYRRRGGAKTSPLSDFYIGAHAAVARYQLLTRDAARFRTYFPGLDIIAPN